MNESVETVIKWVNDRPSPLGLYVFAEDHEVVERILDATSSGDAEVNDCAIHPLFPELPFGGVGNSGMGKYHGKWGFEAFTNARGVLYHSARIDPGVHYPPYSQHTSERKIESRLTPQWGDVKIRLRTYNVSGNAPSEYQGSCHFALFEVSPAVYESGIEAYLLES